MVDHVVAKLAIRPSLCASRASLTKTRGGRSPPGAGAGLVCVLSVLVALGFGRDTVCGRAQAVCRFCECAGARRRRPLRSSSPPLPRSAGRRPGLFPSLYSCSCSIRCCAYGLHLSAVCRVLCHRLHPRLRRRIVVATVRQAVCVYRV